MPNRNSIRCATLPYANAGQIRGAIRIEPIASALGDNVSETASGLEGKEARNVRPVGCQNVVPDFGRVIRHAIGCVGLDPIPFVQERKSCLTGIELCGSEAVVITARDEGPPNKVALCLRIKGVILDEKAVVEPAWREVRVGKVQRAPLARPQDVAGEKEALYVTICLGGPVVSDGVTIGGKSLQGAPQSCHASCAAEP